MSTPKAFIDPSYPGVVRFHGDDPFNGLLAGIRAPMIVSRINAHDRLIETLRMAETEFLTLMPRLSGIYKTNVSAALTVLRNTLKEVTP